MKARVRVHEPVIEGRSVLIDCVYDVAGGSLYSINWRFKGREFLRLLKPFPPAPAPPSPPSHQQQQQHSRQQLVTPAPATSSSSPISVHHRYPGSSRSRKQQQQHSKQNRYSGGRQPAIVTTTSTTAAPAPAVQMNKVFTHVPGIEVDVSLFCLSLLFPCLLRQPHVPVELNAFLTACASLV